MLTILILSFSFPETPILGTKMGMRRETLKALEQVRDNVVTERKQSRMQTLGASNPHNNNRDKHRGATKVSIYFHFKGDCILKARMW